MAIAYKCDKCGKLFEDISGGVTIRYRVEYDEESKNVVHNYCYDCLPEKVYKLEELFNDNSSAMQDDLYKDFGIPENMFYHLCECHYLTGGTWDGYDIPAWQKEAVERYKKWQST